MHARSVENFKQRLHHDPEFNSVWRAYQRRSSELRMLLINSSPKNREVHEASRRDEYRKLRRRIESDPMGLEVVKYRAREWYAALSKQDKERIYIQPAKSRRQNNE